MSATRPVMCHGLRFEATRGGSAFREAQSYDGRIIQVHRVLSGKWRACTVGGGGPFLDSGHHRTMWDAVLAVL